MSSGSPSPDSSPSIIPPVSILTPPTASVSPPPSNPSTSPPPSSPSTSPPPIVPQPNGNSDSPPPSTTPSNSTTPPSPSQSQAPPPSVPASPPPVPLSPPPTTPQAPPPSPPASPPLPTPSPPSNPPPDVSSPPPSASPPPPPEKSPPPAARSPPSPPPPEAVSPSPPPPVESSPPPAGTPPPLPSRSPPPPSAAVPPAKAPPPPRSRPTPPPSNASTPPILSPPPPPEIQPEPLPASPDSPLTPASPQTNTSSGGSPPTPRAPVPTESSTDIGVPTSANSSGGMNAGGTVAIGVVMGLVVITLIGLAVWFMKRRKRKVAGYNGGIMPSPYSSQQSDSSFIKTHFSAPLVQRGSNSGFIYSPPDNSGLSHSRSWFTFEELSEVTNGFSQQNLLGEGGFGSVYKGILPDGREVAVKQLKIGGSQGEREFKAEVETISRIHHRHLVSLVGYCISEDQRLLVYEYVSNNTLYYHLHGQGRSIMDWATRVKVAAGAARGLAYLHEDCHPRIIHRDIKSSNILLDDNFDALVSDFGLAKLASDVYTHISTRVMGTFGYMAPEYASSGKLTDKSDVYSFGVVLLELITGRKPVDASQPLGDESLVEWARPLLNQALDSQEFDELVDPMLENNYVPSEMFRLVEAAAACVRHSAGRRPRMGQVARALELTGDTSDLINGMKPGQSEVYDSAQQSAEIRMFQRMAFGSQDYSSSFFSRGSHSGGYS